MGTKWKNGWHTVCFCPRLSCSQEGLFIICDRTKNAKPGSSVQFRRQDEDISHNGRRLSIWQTGWFLKHASKCSCAPPQLSAANSVMTSLCRTGALVIDCWHKKGNYTRSSALKANEVPTARLAQEILRALVITRAVGAFQNWGETRTCCEPIWQPEGNCHRCPSHCLPCATCSSKFWWLFNKCRFYNVWSEDWNKGLGAGHSKCCSLNCLNKGSIAYFWHTVKLAGVT